MKQDLRQFLEKHVLLAWFASLTSFVIMVAHIKLKKLLGHEPGFFQVGLLLAVFAVFSALSIYMLKRYGHTMRISRHKLMRWSLIFLFSGFLIISVHLVLAFLGLKPNLLFELMTAAGAAFVIGGLLGVAYHVLKSRLEKSP